MYALLSLHRISFLASWCPAWPCDTLEMFANGIKKPHKIIGVLLMHYLDTRVIPILWYIHSIKLVIIQVCWLQAIQAIMFTLYIKVKYISSWFALWIKKHSLNLVSRKLARSWPTVKIICMYLFYTKGYIHAYMHVHTYASSRCDERASVQLKKISFSI